MTTDLQTTDFTAYTDAIRFSSVKPVGRASVVDKLLFSVMMLQCPNEGCLEILDSPAIDDTFFRPLE